MLTSPLSPEDYEFKLDRLDFILAPSFSLDRSPDGFCSSHISWKKINKIKSRGLGEKHDLKTCWMIIYILEIKEKINEKKRENNKKGTFVVKCTISVLSVCLHGSTYTSCTYRTCPRTPRNLNAERYISCRPIWFDYEIAVIISFKMHNLRCCF